ncbi:MAG: D-alanyl-D-alanine carboxypeptidase/D-alanyl-D-alanine-endopeptidase [Candidatus Acidiferrales bacterium]
MKGDGNRSRRYVILFVLAATALCGAAQAGPASSAPARGGARADVARFAARTAAALGAAGASQADWGLLIADADTGQVLYEKNADSYFLPASVAKLFTTALALATLGPEFRVRTTIETQGTLDSSGSLRGDLVLVGRGDPSLSNRKFPFEKVVEHEGPPEKALADLADQVVAHGVKEIEGDIVADDTYLAYERFPEGWAVDDLLWSSGAPVSAIAINDNTFTLEVHAGAREGDPATFDAEPWAGFYTIENSIVTGAHGSPEKIRVSREPGSRTVRLGGTIPAGAAPRELALSIEEPAEYAAALLTKLLEARGVKIFGQARALHAEPPAELVDPPAAAASETTVLAEHVSPPLAEDVRLVNKMSVNLHAELLLRVAAKEKSGEVTLDDALQFSKAFFQNAGLPENSAVMNDGSGLSRRDLVTPRGVVWLLEWAAKQPWGATYRASLPIAGEDGTLAGRMKATPAAEAIQAKTGTLEHINALSGYATTTHGAHLVFSFFGNNEAMHASEGEIVMDAIAIAMVEELRPAPKIPGHK